MEETSLMAPPPSTVQVALNSFDVDGSVYTIAQCNGGLRAMASPGEFQCVLLIIGSC